MRDKEAVWTKKNRGIHHEDLALKTAAQYFGEELLRFMGVPGVVALAAPTETVKLEARKMYQDFNYVMEGGLLGASGV